MALVSDSEYNWISMRLVMKKCLVPVGTQRRLLIENVLLESQMVNGCHKTTLVSRSAMKVDITNILTW